METISPEKCERYGINPDLFKPTVQQEQDVVTESTQNFVTEIIKNVAAESMQDVDSERVQNVVAESLQDVDSERVQNVVVESVEPSPKRKRSSDCEDDSIDNPSERLLKLTKCSLRSQVVKLVYDSKPMIVISYISTAKIFEYKKKSGKYIKLREIPDRQIPSQIITCLHHDDSKFYLGYMWGNRKKVRKPYIEKTDIMGHLIGEPYFYDSTLQSIRSDNMFIYVQTINNMIHIHRKELFTCIHYRFDFGSMSTDPHIGTWIDLPQFDPFTRLPMITATTREILVTQYDALDYRFIQCYKFNDDYNIVSIDKLDSLIIIHRNSPSRSRIEFGFISRIKEKSEDYYFIHEAFLSFDCNILQVKHYETYLYILTENAAGCIYMPSLKPMWAIQHDSVCDSSCHIVPHDGHVALIRRNQEISSLKRRTRVDFDRFFNMKISTNKHLQALGASIFRKLHR